MMGDDCNGIPALQAECSDIGAEAATRWPLHFLRVVS